jgi:hypothetical protein
MTIKELKPGDMILWVEGDGASTIVSIAFIDEFFARITVLEPWPMILSTYEVFQDQSIPCRVILHGDTTR